MLTGDREEKRTVFGSLTQREPSAERSEDDRGIGKTEMTKRTVPFVILGAREREHRKSPPVSRRALGSVRLCPEAFLYQKQGSSGMRPLT